MAPFYQTSADKTLGWSTGSSEMSAKFLLHVVQEVSAVSNAVLDASAAEFSPAE